MIWRAARRSMSFMSAVFKMNSAILGCTFNFWKSDAWKNVIWSNKGAKRYRLPPNSSLYRQGITWTRRWQSGCHSLAGCKSSSSNGRVRVGLRRIQERAGGSRSYEGISWRWDCRDYSWNGRARWVRHDAWKLKAAGVHSVAFSVSRYLNTIDYFLESAKQFD